MQTKEQLYRGLNLIGMQLLSPTSSSKHEDKIGTASDFTPEKKSSVNFNESRKNNWSIILLFILTTIQLPIVIALFIRMLKNQKRKNFISKNTCQDHPLSNELLSIRKFVDKNHSDISEMKTEVHVFIARLKENEKELANLNNLVNSYRKDIMVQIEKKVEEILKKQEKQDNIALIHDVLKELRNIILEQLDKNKETLIIDDEGVELKERIEHHRQVLEKLWNNEALALIRNHLMTLPANIKDNTFFDRVYKLAILFEFEEDPIQSTKGMPKKLREYDDYLKRIMNVPVLLSSLPGSQFEVVPLEMKLQIIQKQIEFLRSLHKTEVASFILNFSIEKWIRKEFWEFVDLFYRKYQRNVYAHKNTDEMEEAKNLIDRILEEFKLAVVPIEIGKTQFNSCLHIAISHTKISGMRDLLISDVIRNGFSEIGGVILNPPEVIVNRMP